MHARFLSPMLALALPAAASAFECLPSTPREQFADAEWVFVGDVVARTADSASLRVRRTLKGPPDREASIALDEYSPLAVPAADGRAMLVFAKRQDQAWVASICSGTSAVRRQDERLIALGLEPRDLEALGLPTDAALMRRLAAEWAAYREALLACPDAHCYRRLRADDRNDPATLAYYERELPNERALHAALAAPGAYRLVGGGVSETAAYLRFVLTQPYQPPQQAAYDGFEVDFRRIGDERWVIQGVGPRVLRELQPVRDGYRGWTDPPR